MEANVKVGRGEFYVQLPRSLKMGSYELKWFRGKEAAVRKQAGRRSKLQKPERSWGIRLTLLSVRLCRELLAELFSLLSSFSFSSFTCSWSLSATRLMPWPPAVLGSGVTGKHFYRERRPDQTFCSTHSPWRSAGNVQSKWLTGFTLLDSEEKTEN